MMYNCTNTNSTVIHFLFGGKSVKTKKVTINCKCIMRDFLRHWPIWTVSFLIYLFTVFMANSIVFGFLDGDAKVVYVVRVISDLISTETFMTFIMGIVGAWAAFGFFGKKRKHFFFETLPYNRISLFINRYIFGFLLCIVPCIMIFFVEIFHILAYTGHFEIVLLLKALILAFIESFFWYSFGVMIFVVSGRIMMAGFCYFFFSLIGLALEFYLEICNNIFFIGYESGSGAGESLFGILSPVRYLFDIQVTLKLKYTEWADFKDAFLSEGSDIKLIVAFITGIILLFVAYFLYARRKAENTGDTVVFKGMKLVFSWISSFFGTITLSLIVYALLFYHKNAIAHLISERIKLLILVGILGYILYFISCMIVEKRFRVFKKNCMNALIFTAFMIIFSIGYMHDVFNIEGYVPDPLEVDYINMNDYDSGFGIYNTSDPTLNVSIRDAKTIQLFTELHELVVDNFDSIEEIYTRSGFTDYGVERGNDYYHFNLNYKMNNGSSINRSYCIYKGSDLDKEIRERIERREKN